MDTTYTLIEDFATDHEAEIAATIIKNWGYNYGQQGFGFINPQEYKLWKSDTKFMTAESEDKKLIGFVAYEKYSMANTGRFSPCLSCLWVHEDYRNRGIGGELVKKMTEVVYRLTKNPKIYLWLLDTSLTSWFESLGWKHLVRLVYLTRWVSIMELNLDI
jgi:N-acetylglutamate synthase-like GNAT family acetyltransferase